MDSAQLSAWVTANIGNAAVRNEFRIIAVLYGLSPNGGQVQVGNRIINHLATLPAGTPALWDPAVGIVPPAPIAPIAPPVVPPVVPPAPIAPIAPPVVVPLAGYRPRRWTYNRMVNRADRPWLEGEATDFGVAAADTLPDATLRNRIFGYTSLLRPWQRIPHDVRPLNPVAPVAPVAPAPRQVDFGPLAFVLGSLGVLAVAALLIFGVILPLAHWGWEHSFGDDDTTLVTRPDGSGNGNGNGSTGNGNGSTNISLVNGEVDSDKNGIPDETRHDLNMIQGQNGCPTDNEAQQALGGLTVHWISGCLFKWNSNNVDFVTRACPIGWYCTLDMGSNNVAWKGDGSMKRFEGGSFWPLASRTFDNDCTYLRHENVYAAIVGDPPTLAGNFKCDGSTTTVSSTSTQTGSTASATTTTGSSNGCLIKSTDDAAAKIGGSASNWKQLEPGVFKYLNKGTYASGFKHPGGTGQLDYWGKDKPETFTSAGEVPYPQDEMTFKCS